MLWVFLGIAVGASALGVVASPGTIPLVNFSTITLVFLVFSLAVLATGLERHMSHSVMTALYYSFGACLAIGVIEVLTGIRLIASLYPDASTLAINNRFLVAAFFPNYNDFAVVITMFALMALTRFLVDARGRLVQTGRAVSYLVATVIIVGQGSRGALLGLLIGSAVVLLQAMRLSRPKLITAPSVILGGLAVVFVGLVIWTTPWIQDHSTSAREDIVSNTLRMTPDTSWQFWFGWGDSGTFKDAAAKAFPWQLMDPHNIVLESFVWYGAVATVLFAAVWAYVCWRGLWRLETRPGWTSTAAVVLFGLIPVLGVVPSSSLRYYYVFLLAACAYAGLLDRSERSHGR